MGLLDKLFGGKGKESETATVAIDCPHAVLVPRWDSVQDMGLEDKVTRYMCEACHEEFTPEVALNLRDTIDERMKQYWAETAKAAEK